MSVIGFEPDKRAFEKLAKDETPGFRYINTALSDRTKELNFLLTRKQECSSGFQPDAEFFKRFAESQRFDVIGRESCDAVAMDEALRENGVTDVDFVKIDAEGAEIEIMRGGAETIAHGVFGLELEVAFVPFRKGQPVFADIDQVVREQGFDLFDIQGAYWKRKVGIDYGKPKGQLIFGNALYLRRAAVFAEQIIARVADPLERKSKLLRAVSICLLYGYKDYALELLDVIAGVLSTEERQAVEASIKREPLFHYRRIPHFPGKGRVSAFFHVLSELFKSTIGGWGFMERTLGNL